MPGNALARVWAAIEDWLIPTLRLTTHERALYYHLVRRTRLAGPRAVRVSRRQLARVLGLSTYTARHYLRLLVRKGCIRFLDRSPRGCLVEVRLPEEISARLARAPRSERLVFAPREVERDAAGQPRAWPRSDHFRSLDFRARILQRDASRCFYCRRPLRAREWTLDHVVPVARGGSDHASNLVACCSPCNWDKGLAPAEEFLRALARKKVLSGPQLRSRRRALPPWPANPPPNAGILPALECGGLPPPCFLGCHAQNRIPRRLAVDGQAYNQTHREAS